MNTGLSRHNRGCKDTYNILKFHSANRTDKVKIFMITKQTQIGRDNERERKREKGQNNMQWGFKDKKEFICWQEN